MNNTKDLTCEKLIEARKKLWRITGDLKKDKEFVESLSGYLAEESGRELLLEIYAHPEYLIEMAFLVVDKNQKTVPFFLNDVQRKFLNRINEAIEEYEAGERTHLYFLLLKGRQQGFTTFITAYQLAISITQPNFAGYTLADSTENATDIFQDKAKYVYDLLPPLLKPEEKFNTRRELHFQNDKGTGLNSRWRINTAGNKDAGRSKTINFFHGSEGAFWKDLKTSLGGLMEALTKNCIAIIETTANGYNEYKDLWDADNNWENLFFEWWETPEYKINPSRAKRDFVEKVKTSVPSEDVQSEMWCLNRCKWLKEEKGLTWSQLYWYYNKWKDKGELVQQEYPCTPEEAFLASGRNYFSVENITRQLSIERKMQKELPVIRGDFEYEYETDPNTMDKVIDNSSIRFIENVNGSTHIYIEPADGKPYGIGADTAGDGSDRNIAQVIDNTGEQQAVLKIEKDEDLFAEQMYCLGHMYNWALTAVEVNYSTHPVKILVERGYPNVYIREQAPDAFSGSLYNKYGFNTNRGNRNSILGELRTLVRENIEKVHDITTLKEMLTFITNEKGKPEAEEGKHDDTVMSYAIALVLKDKLTLRVEKDIKELKGFNTRSELEDMGYSDYEIRKYLEAQRIYD